MLLFLSKKFFLEDFIGTIPYCIFVDTSITETMKETLGSERA